MDEKRKNLILGCLSVLGAILIHFTFGHFYTVANMAPYIMGYVKARVNPELPDSASIWLSALALGLQGITMPLGGIIAKKIGFRAVVGISCLLDSGSILLTYFTIQKTYVGVIVTYSVLLGAGLGLGYSVVLAVASSWFPARRGLVVGMIVGGFGLGAFGFTPVQSALINPTNIKVDNVTRHFTDPELLDRVPRAFLILGAILLSIQIVGFALLRAKPQTSAPQPEPGSQDKFIARQETSKATTSANQEINVSPKELFKRIDFYLLWFIMFCNIIPITIITSVYKLFGQNHISDDRFLSAVATASSIFNAGGRVVWGAIVDRISFKIPLCFMLILWSFILITFPHLASSPENVMKGLYAIWVCVMFFALSGVFVIMPAATGNLFGPANLAVNYGMVFNAFAFGSVLCAIATTLLQAKQAYLAQFTVCACVCLVACFTALWLQDRKIPGRANLCRVCANTCQSLRGRGIEESSSEELHKIHA